MKRFRVEWQPEAIDDLAEIWLLASDRVAVNYAADVIDANLAEDPMGRGDELSEGLYRLGVHSIRVVFSVDHAQKLVEVWRAFPRQASDE